VAGLLGCWLDVLGSWLAGRLGGAGWAVLRFCFFVCGLVVLGGSLVVIGV